MGRKKQTLDKLLSNTIKDGDCLIWTKCCDKDGYGISSIGGKKMPAHRAAMILSGVLVNDYVLHKCNNRKCINPEHLYVGTQQQNVQDQIDSGSFVYGSKNGMAKLDEMSVEHIRSSGFSTRQLADYYDVSYYTVWDVRNFRSWKQTK